MKPTVIVLAAAMLSCVGCLSERTSGLVVEKGRLTVENAALADELVIERDVTGTTEEGHLRVQVFVKNSNKDDWGCQYRFQWFDKDGFQMSQTAEPWKPALFHGRELSQFESVCPLEGAVDYRLIIRNR